MAYKSMNPLIYFSVTILLYIVEITLAILLDDIGQIFGFIGTFAGCGLQFFIPSMFVIIGMNTFGTEEFNSQNKIWKTSAYINFAVGVVLFFVFLANNVLGIVYAESEPPTPCVPKD